MDTLALAIGFLPVHTFWTPRFCDAPWLPLTCLGLFPPAQYNSPALERTERHGWFRNSTDYSCGGTSCPTGSSIERGRCLGCLAATSLLHLAQGAGAANGGSLRHLLRGAARDALRRKGRGTRQAYGAWDVRRPAVPDYGKSPRPER